MDILERGSDGSEPAAGGDLGAASLDTPGPMGTREDLTDTGHRRSSDRLLLAAILNDLKDISAPRHHPSSSPQPGWLTLSNEDGDRSSETGPCPSSPQSHVGGQDRDRDVPPLLRQASPVTSFDRDTPPPLKHKDAGSHQPSPVSPHSVSTSWLEDSVPPVPTLRTPDPVLRLDSFHSSAGVSGQRSPPADLQPAETSPLACSTSGGQGDASTDPPPSPAASPPPPCREERIGSALTEAEMHPGKSTVELPSPTIASVGQMDRRTLSGWDRRFNHCDPDSLQTLTGTPPISSHLPSSLPTTAPTQTHSQHV